MNKRNTRKITWGGGLVAAAVLIITNALYNFIGFLPLIVIIVLTPVAVKSILRRSFGGLFILLAILGIVFDEQLGIESITPLPIIAAAILLAIAFEIMFRKNSFTHIGKTDFNCLENNNGSDADCTVRFGESTRYFSNENLEKVYLKCDFGALTAYFDGATLSPNGAILYVEANFAGIELFIPKHWNVLNNMSVIIGGVDEKGKNNLIPDSPTLTIVGKASFAGIEIRYV